VTLAERPSLVGEWTPVAREVDLVPDVGVAVRAGCVQIAVFALSDGAVFAIGNLDPFSGVNVLSRGIVGDRMGEPKVASPMYKQSFSLRTGLCLDDPNVSVPVYPVRVTDGVIEVFWS
jgi:nitrite reductase (NADH) small subunit